MAKVWPSGLRNRPGASLITNMTSRERLLAAARRQEVDYLPCSIYFNNNLEVDGYNLKEAKERIRLQADLGGDPVAYLAISNLPHPEVETRTWIEEKPDEKHPILYKEYSTPAGKLRYGIYYTPDWPYGKNIPWNDHTASHLHEPLIKTPDDAAAFAYIWHPPDQSCLEAVRSANEETYGTAEKYRIAVQGYAGAGLATLLFVMGAENAILFSVDYPEVFQRLAEIDSRTNIERIKLCARAGADLVKRFGGYEQTNFYNPHIFRTVVLPLLRREVETAHEEGLLIYYRVVTGMEPVLDEIASAGFDCIEGGEPHLSGCSLEMWHDAFAGKRASWTGISTPVLLGRGDTRTVRREVRHCVEVFGRTGFILGITNSIRKHFRWENVLAMIDEWKKIR